MTPLVSIGLPVFNGEDYLGAAIESILGQSVRDIELVISDNASTDSTWDICLRYAGKDARIRLFRNETNLGAAENYNRVFREASDCKYFKWAAHDDLCAPEFLERCLDVLENDNSVVLCHPRSQFMDEAGNLLGTYTEDDSFTAADPSRRFQTWLFERTSPWCHAIFGVIRRRELAATGLIGKYNSSDVILLGELALRGKMLAIPDVLFLRRDHPGRSGRANPDNQTRATWFDPSSAGRTHTPNWQWLREYLRAIGRVRVGAVEKLRCYGLMARWCSRNRSQLKNELVGASKSWRNGRTRLA